MSIATLPPAGHVRLPHPSGNTPFKPFHWKAWGFALLVVLSAGAAGVWFWSTMEAYEKVILPAAALGLIGLAALWPTMRLFSIGSALLTLTALALYQNDLAHAETVFGLKYFLSSQSLLMWMCVCVYLATGCYWVSLLARAQRVETMANGLSWTAALAAASWLFVRWYESYLIAPDVGHIPVSSLYEVFVLFCLITLLFCLYYQRKLRARFGAFVLLVVAAAVSFLLWYTFARQAQTIQPLVPALQSWWMKIHVPANFIGYGGFASAAMLSLAQLLVSRGWLADHLPCYDTLGEAVYRAIAVGFLFFTIATILGALWAAEAWGGYWSWDPKETWSLILWLNYAAWLHIRQVKGMRGNFLAWWSLVGLGVMTFAFIGVNLWLSGLHSYGTL